MATPKQVKTPSETNVNNEDTMYDIFYFIFCFIEFMLKCIIFIL
jgi:hypothetical protein